MPLENPNSGQRFYVAPAFGAGAALNRPATGRAGSQSQRRRAIQCRPCGDEVSGCVANTKSSASAWSRPIANPTRRRGKELNSEEAG